MKIPATAFVAIFLTAGAFVTPASASCSHVTVTGTTYPVCGPVPEPFTCVTAGDPTIVQAHVCATKLLS